MPTFKIDADIFARMSHASYKHGSDSWPDFQCVRLEHINFKTYVVACNRHILAIEYIGETDEQNFAVNITNAPALIAWCKGATTISVEGWNGVDAALVQIDGHTYVNPLSSVIVINNEPKFIGWWHMVPVQQSRIDRGFLFLETELLTLLGNASPSGKLCFPEVIDNKLPVIVRDADNPNWCGVFLIDNRAGKPATIPGWLPQ